MALRALLLLHRRGGLLQGRADVDRPAPHRAAGGTRQHARADRRAQRAVGVDSGVDMGVAWTVGCRRVRWKVCTLKAGNLGMELSAIDSLAFFVHCSSFYGYV